jgi:hypothetical protein
MSRCAQLRSQFLDMRRAHFAAAPDDTGPLIDPRQSDLRIGLWRQIVTLF